MSGQVTVTAGRRTQAESDIQKGVLLAASGAGRASWKEGVEVEPQRQEREKVEGRASQAGAEFHPGRCRQWMWMAIGVSWALSLCWALVRVLCMCEVL